LDPESDALNVITTGAAVTSYSATWVATDVNCDVIVPSETVTELATNTQPELPDSTSVNVSGYAMPREAAVCASVKVNVTTVPGKPLDGEMVLPVTATSARPTSTVCMLGVTVTGFPLSVTVACILI